MEEKLSVLVSKLGTQIDGVEAMFREIYDLGSIIDKFSVIRIDRDIKSLREILQKIEDKM